MRISVSLFGAFALVSSAVAIGDECTNVPPRCAAANSRAAVIVEEITARPGAEMADSLHKGYCATLIGIEVNRFCAVEYRKNGLESCAEQIDAQTEMYRQTIPVFEQSMDSLVISKIQQKCHWEE